MEGQKSCTWLCSLRLQTPVLNSSLKLCHNPPNDAKNVLFELFRAYHTSRLHSFRNAASIGVTPESMTLEVLAPSVHNEGKCMDVPPHTHEGQKPHTALHQYLLFLLLHNRTTEIFLNIFYNLELVTETETETEELHWIKPDLVPFSIMFQLLQIC